MATPNLEKVKEILQDHKLNLFFRQNNAQEQLDFQEIQISSKIPIGMTITLRPPPSSTDTFWLAQVTSILPSKKYHFHYYSYNYTTKIWNLGRGKYFQGSTSYGAIIYAGMCSDKSIL